MPQFKNKSFLMVNLIRTVSRVSVYLLLWSKLSKQRVFW